MLLLISDISIPTGGGAPYALITVIERSLRSTIKSAFGGRCEYTDI